jgi:N-acetylglucosaminyl-diphospho-decaprenol L-rhamnosyltransferase
MILSVVIVSYNVKFFLEQCLSCLKKAVVGSSFPGDQIEVFIVDNASSDGSMAFLIPAFPEFHFIQNNENTGFAKANNQALTLCTGEFILFLNPDTILAEDSLDICLSFFRSTPDAGAVGVHMIDGTGNYLKESKRGFPSVRSSFYKMVGLARLFPRSKIFSGYYMGHLNEGSHHVVDILSGAFMMVKKNILDKTSGFDEQFFMYAEDIDLSFRIRQCGYQNYYLSETTIIHFKGESTRKDIRYVNMFYTAMEQFIQKHFQPGQTSRQLHLLTLGIRIHKLMSRLQLAFKKAVTKSGIPGQVFIRGGPDSKIAWQNYLAAKKIPFTDHETEADEIIFCEGPLQSWKSIIAEIENSKNRFRYKFHGTATHAAVGSNSSREPGEIFEL